MAILSHEQKEIKAKIVYCGPGLSGKTTTIQYIYNKMRPDHRGKLTTLSTSSDRTIYFDFLPVELGEIQGYHTRFHIFTVPGQVKYNAARQAVLRDVDGIVFVADSQRSMRDENVRSLTNLMENLGLQGRGLDSVVHVFQYNKRDLSDVLSIQELQTDLNAFDAPYFESIASQGKGALNTLKTISKLVLRQLREVEDFEEREGMTDEEYLGLEGDYVSVGEVGAQASPGLSPPLPPMAVPIEDLIKAAQSVPDATEVTIDVTGEIPQTAPIQPAAVSVLDEVRAQAVVVDDGGSIIPPTPTIPMAPVIEAASPVVDIATGNVSNNLQNAVPLTEGGAPMSDIPEVPPVPQAEWTAESTELEYQAAIPAAEPIAEAVAVAEPVDAAEVVPAVVQVAEAVPAAEVYTEAVPAGVQIAEAVPAGVQVAEAVPAGVAVAEAVPVTEAIPQAAGEAPTNEFVIARIGQATPEGAGKVSLPIVFMDPGSGQEYTATLTINLSNLIPGSD